MRACAVRRRSLVACIVLLSVVGLTIPISLAQSRPGGSTTTGPAAPQAALRQRLAEKVAELSKRIEERLELQRLAGRASDELAREEDLARGGRSVEAMNAGLKDDEYQIRQVEIQCDLMIDQYGREHPRYKALAQQLAKMRKVYEGRRAIVRSNAKAILESVRGEAESAQMKLDEALRTEEALKRELIDLAASAGATR